MNKLTPREAAYLAGLIDGEGTITIHRRRPLPSNQFRLYYRPVVIIINTDLPLLEHVKKICGTGWVGISMHGHGERKTCYNFQLGRRSEIYWLLTQILDDLFLKKEQGELLLEFINSRDNNLLIMPYKRGKPAGYTKREEEIIDRLHHLHMRTKTIDRITSPVLRSVNSLPSIA